MIAQNILQAKSPIEGGVSTCQIDHSMYNDTLDDPNKASRYLEADSMDEAEEIPAHRIMDSTGQPYSHRKMTFWKRAEAAG
jgi:hypothetical protein